MRFICIISMAIILVGCTVAPTTVNLDLKCAWENGTEFYGTMDLVLSLEGENQGAYSGEGPISGTALVRGLDGSVLLDSAVSGSWENRVIGGGDDIVDLEIATADARLSILTSLTSATAEDLDDQCFLSGGMTLDAFPGYWHTAPSSAGIRLPNVLAAWSIGTSGWEFLDMAMIDSEIFAVYLDAGEYSIARATPGSSGQATLLNYSSTCAEPYAIANDGIYTWVVGKAAEGDTDPSLFKYLGSNFSTNQPGYPVPNTALSIVDALSTSGGNLYFHNGEILRSGMGTINLTSGATTYLLQDEWNGSTPAMARTSKIDVLPNILRTTTFAPGDWWGELRSIALPGGSLSAACWCPVNDIGLMASNGTTLYLIQASANRLYAIGL
jgi:hypothetical protein